MPLEISTGPQTPNPRHGHRASNDIYKEQTLLSVVQRRARSGRKPEFLLSVIRLFYGKKGKCGESNGRNTMNFVIHLPLNFLAYFHSPNPNTSTTDDRKLDDWKLSQWPLFFGGRRSPDPDSTDFLLSHEFRNDFTNEFPHRLDNEFAVDFP